LVYGSVPSGPSTQKPVTASPSGTASTAVPTAGISNAPSPTQGSNVSTTASVSSETLGSTKSITSVSATASETGTAAPVPNLSKASSTAPASSSIAATTQPVLSSATQATTTPISSSIAATTQPVLSSATPRPSVVITSTKVVGTTTTAIQITSSRPIPTQPTNPNQVLTPAQMNAFVTTQGNQFMLNGQPFYWGGANNYYLFYADQKDVDATFRDAAKLRIPVMRTWAFSDGEKGIASSNAQNNGKKVWFQELVNGQIVFNDSTDTGIGRLDFVIESAKKHGVKLIMTLTNNWADFGGADWYVERIGSGTKSHSSFFSDEAIKQAYKNYVRHIMNRVNTISGVKYSDDPTILGWELINEARCVGSEIGGRFKRDSGCKTFTLTNWVNEMSTFIKERVSSKQLLGVGAEGFFTDRPRIKSAFNSLTDGSEGYDFDGVAELKNVDMLDLHSYMMHWGVERDPEFTDATLLWIKMHGDVAKRVNKPVYLGEYGVLKKEQRTTSLMQFQKAAMENNYGGTAIWMLCSDYQNGKYPNFDGFCMYADDGDIDQVLVQHNRDMLAKQ
jgi:hypothetical protein